MFTRDFHPVRFLRSVAGTDVFEEYCRLRGIAFDCEAVRGVGEAELWADALARLPRDGQAEAELELAKVNELAGRDASSHLLAAADGHTPPPVSVPGGAPLALWFLLHRHDLFEEVFFQHEVRTADRWRTGRAAPGVAVADLPRASASLGEAVREFFRACEGTGRFCMADAHRLPSAVCFAARVSDRVRLVDGFSDAGEPVAQRLRPAVSVLFAYHPADGTVLLKSRLRAADRVAELMARLSEAALGVPAAPAAGAFDLERLKFPFRPAPDREDMELVRVKSLHLRYPARLGARTVKLETAAGSSPATVEHLLRAHAGPALDDLRVCYAELEVRLRVEGRGKNYAVRLWPNRCGLGRTALADRFRACLRDWGLSRVG